MSYLIDTNVMLWLLNEPERLPTQILDELMDRSNIVVFSSISIWEISIKSGLDKLNFQIDPAQVRSDFFAEGLIELAFSGDHALSVRHLPLLHKDPFDRALIAQAKCENKKLLTTDKLLGKYGNWVEVITK